MTAAASLQWRIDIEQQAEAIKYGQRALRETGTHLGAPWAQAQWHAAREACALIDVECPYAPCYGGAELALKTAAAEYKALLKDAKAACGGVRQLRLALAAEGAHEFALAS
jgi:hypothetical protein